MPLGLTPMKHNNAITMKVKTRLSKELVLKIAIYFHAIPGQFNDKPYGFCSTLFTFLRLEGYEVDDVLIY